MPAVLGISSGFDGEDSYPAMNFLWIMVGESPELEDEVFWSDSIRNISLEFEVPKFTAVVWERDIGDVDVIKKTIGRNGPDNYLNLIRRREWIPDEQEDREEAWVEPVKRWCTRKSDGVHLVHKSEKDDFRSEHDASGIQSMGLGSGWRAVALKDGSTKCPGGDPGHGINWTEEMLSLQAEFERKEEWVKYEMRRVDSEWIGLTQELRSVENELIGIYRNHLDRDSRQFQYKKDKIIELKRAFPYLRANAELVAEATDSSYSYVNEFKHIPQEGVANRRVKGKLRDEVLERDGHACVSCGNRDDLHVHHIIPRGQGGENSKENLATLCANCHYYAHGGGQPTDDGRYTAASWDSVEYNDQVEFWDEWVQLHFDERAPKGFTHADSQFEE